MTKRATLAVVVIVLAPLGIATWILAAHTVGESLSPSTVQSSAGAAAIGFAVALLAVMATGYVLLLSHPPEVPNLRFGSTLVICGSACVLVALVLQFYLAHLAGENSRRIAEIMSDGLKRGERLNVNLNAPFPESVKGVGYLALFAGIWLAAMGIRIGVGRIRPAEPAGGSPKSTEPPPLAEEGIRQAPG